MAVEPESYAKVYEEYAKTLRTWLVAYGIGGPVLLLTNDAVRSTIVASGSARYITRAFLLGVALQVFLAFKNKHALWRCYVADEVHPERKKNSIDKAAFWLEDNFWIDVFGDLASLLCIGWAAYRALEILAVQ
jgi:hypothetical protein